MIKAWADRADLTLLQTTTGIARYWLAYGSVIPSALAGIATGLASGSRRAGVNVTGSLWSELASGFSGIDMVVKGEEHLWSSRPCVFIFNHQSACEVFLCGRLIRRDIFGIAKKEARAKPIAGLVMDLMGTVFIDRANRQGAIASMRPAIDALKGGRSMLIAPEGTRSTDGRLRPFKKGAFHIAMAARVPLLPILFHDSGKRLRPGSGIARPGLVHVTVLPPIPTKKWKAAELDRRVDEVHRLFAKTLGQKNSRRNSRPRSRTSAAKKGRKQ